MNASKSLLIVSKKKNNELVNLLKVEVIKSGYNAINWTDSEYTKSDSTKIAPRVIFIGESKPMKQIQNSLDKKLDNDGLNLYIGANQAILNIDSHTVNKNVVEWYPKNSLSRIKAFNEGDNQLHKGINNINQKVSGVWGKYKEKKENFEKKGKKSKILSEVTTTAVDTAAFAVAVTNIPTLAATTGVLLSQSLSKKDLTDDAYVALVYLFVNDYLDDFMNATSNDLPKYKTAAEIKEILKAEKDDTKAQGTEEQETTGQETDGNANE